MLAEDFIASGGLQLTQTLVDLAIAAVVVARQVRVMTNSNSALDCGHVYVQEDLPEHFRLLNSVHENLSLINRGIH